MSHKNAYVFVFLLFMTYFRTTRSSPWGEPKVTRCSAHYRRSKRRLLPQLYKPVSSVFFNLHSNVHVNSQFHYCNMFVNRFTAGVSIKCQLLTLFWSKLLLLQFNSIALVVHKTHKKSGSLSNLFQNWTSPMLVIPLDLFSNAIPNFAVFLKVPTIKLTNLVCETEAVKNPNWMMFRHSLFLENCVPGCVNKKFMVYEFLFVLLFARINVG